MDGTTEFLTDAGGNFRILTTVPAYDGFTLANTIVISCEWLN